MRCFIEVFVETDVNWFIHNDDDDNNNNDLKIRNKKFVLLILRILPTHLLLFLSLFLIYCLLIILCVLYIVTHFTSNPFQPNTFSNLTKLISLLLFVTATTTTTLMASWKKTIISPFRKACTIFNQNPRDHPKKSHSDSGNFTTPHASTSFFFFFFFFKTTHETLLFFFKSSSLTFLQLFNSLFL